MSRFLYSDDGVKFLKDQIRSYFPYWKMKSTSVVALRSEIIADSIDAEIPSAGIMAELPVDFRLSDTAAPTVTSRTSVPQTIAKETPSAPRCSPGTCSCLPAFRPTPCCPSPLLAPPTSLLPVPSGDQAVSPLPSAPASAGVFYGVPRSPWIS